MYSPGTTQQLCSQLLGAPVPYRRGAMPRPPNSHCASSSTAPCSSLLLPAPERRSRAGATGAAGRPARSTPRGLPPAPPQPSGARPPAQEAPRCPQASPRAAGASLRGAPGRGSRRGSALPPPGGTHLGRHLSDSPWRPRGGPGGPGSRRRPRAPPAPGGAQRPRRV